MPRCALICCLYLLMAGGSGCAICQAPDDANYAAFGGLVERVDPAHGRAGSAFAPAEATVVGEENAPPPLDPPPEPDTRDDQQEDEDSEAIDPSRRLETAF